MRVTYVLPGFVSRHGDNIPEERNEYTRIEENVWVAEEGYQISNPMIIDKLETAFKNNVNWTV